MTFRILTDAQWEKIEPHCSGKASERGVTAKDNRLFVEAVLWISQTGSSWRSLPEFFGSWHTIYVRFSRWKKKGIWVRIIEALEDEPKVAQVLNFALMGRTQHARIMAGNVRSSSVGVGERNLQLVQPHAR